MRSRRRRLFVLFSLLAFVAAVTVAYALWHPGEDRTDGRHDRGANATWLAHGWMGDDAWFRTNARDPARYRTREAREALARRLRAHHVTTVYPHLCPAEGPRPAAHDPAETERFLDAMEGVRVMPWVGGVFERQAMPDEAWWRTQFARNLAALLAQHPRLAGVHVNVEPWPDGHAGMLLLLDAIRAALPPGKLISVAAFPPPTRWQEAPEVHWSAAYTRAVARRSDELAVMLYDTAIVFPKAYEQLMARWTREVLAAAAPTAVLLGVPAYDDADKPWHRPWVEDLPHALRGIHAGLGENPPPNYRGVALYAEWEVDDAEWRWLREHFLRPDVEALTLRP